MHLRYRIRSRDDVVFRSRSVGGIRARNKWRRGATPSRNVRLLGTSEVRSPIASLVELARAGHFTAPRGGDTVPGSRVRSGRRIVIVRVSNRVCGPPSARDVVRCSLFANRHIPLGFTTEIYRSLRVSCRLSIVRCPCSRRLKWRRTPTSFFTPTK